VVQQTLDEIATTGGTAIANHADLSNPKNGNGYSARWSRKPVHQTSWSTTPR
jgi:hypothetical protein